MNAMKKSMLNLGASSVLILLCLLTSQNSSAATLKCMFTGGTTVSAAGVWVKNTDMMSIIKMFGAEGLKLSVENSLLGQLDKKEVFLGGETTHGKVYLLGGSGGVEAKTISVEGDLITIYSGLCQVGFG